MDVKKILKEATDNGASDIFIVAGRPLTYKSKGVMECLNEIRMIPKETFEFVTSIYALAERDISKFEETGDDDFSFAIPGVSRYRVSTFKQRGSYSAVIRVISFTLPKPSDLHIPDSVMELAETNNGMVLVTGPAGSGKSTTLACIIDQINHEKEEHIITLEDPLEFLHRHDKCIVSQREINTDTESYLTDRIIDAFPASQQHQIAIQLASVLQAVVCQKLLPATNGEMVPAFEIMVLTPAIRNLIREGKVHQIDGIIYTSAAENMIAMDTSIFNLYKAGVISKHVAISEATNPEMMSKRINLN